jgi:hypothetical protein
MRRQTEDKLTKLLRVIVSSTYPGEIAAALQRMRKILDREGLTAPDVCVWLPVAVATVLTPPPPSPPPAELFIEELEASARITIIPFGRHKGKVFSDVWRSDPHYFKALMLKQREEENPKWSPPTHIMELVHYFLTRYPERTTPPHARHF